jgi:uncharacterized protein (TIGR00369 family)
VTTRLERVNTYAARSPIASWLGLVTSGTDEITYRLTFNEVHIGNPAIRALHGGAIATFLEFAMQADLFSRALADVATVNISIDYLASSKPEDMIARVKLLRQGRRIAFMEASGWQADESRLVAVARACFKLG